MKAMSFDVQTLKSRLLIYEAKRWIGFTEVGGDNHGQIVEAFQKVVDGRASGEAWCMAALQFWLKHVDEMMNEVVGRTLAPHELEITEHCLTCWHKSPVVNRHDQPAPGRVVIWQHGNTTSGHCGVVAKVDFKNGFIWTIEGNTGSSDSSVQREGDGVYLKRRSIKGVGRMNVVGYLQPWN